MKSTSWSTYLAVVAAIFSGSAAQVMADRLGEAPPPKRNVAHSKAPFTVKGPFTLDEDTIEWEYDLSAEHFGTTQVRLYTDPVTGLPVHGPQRIRDLHYDLGNGQVGIRPIPISEPHSEGDPNDPQRPGSHLVDAFLRNLQGLSASDPVFATIVYIHPELNQGDISELARDALKTEGGQTHLGMYVGEGNSLNSPWGYHDNGWDVAGYPATVQTIALDGVDQATLNRNLAQWAHILNGTGSWSVRFPDDYKNDVYQTITLGRTLGFARGWLEKDSKLRNDNSWATYCAEHVTIVINSGLNVPFNEASFRKVWGDDGPGLLAKARAAYKEVTGEDLVETRFTPLWERDGISDPASFGVGDEVRMDEIGPGLAWPPQHNADLVKNFLEVYASWPDVGAPASAAALLAFKGQIVDRMTDFLGDDPDAEAAMLGRAYNSLAMPVLTKMFVFEAMSQGSEAKATEYRTQAPVKLFLAVGGESPDQLAELRRLRNLARNDDGEVDTQRLAQLATAAGMDAGDDRVQKAFHLAALVEIVERALDDRKVQILTAAAAGLSREAAYGQFQQAIRGRWTPPVRSTSATRTRSCASTRPRR